MENYASSKIWFIGKQNVTKKFQFPRIFPRLFPRHAVTDYHTIDKNNWQKLLLRSSTLLQWETFLLNTQLRNKRLSGELTETDFYKGYRVSREAGGCFVETRLTDISSIVCYNSVHPTYLQTIFIHSGEPQIWVVKHPSNEQGRESEMSVARPALTIDGLAALAPLYIDPGLSSLSSPLSPLWLQLLWPPVPGLVFPLLHIDRGLLTATCLWEWTNWVVLSDRNN